MSCAHDWMPSLELGLGWYRCTRCQDTGRRPGAGQPVTAQPLPVRSSFNGGRRVLRSDKPSPNLRAQAQDWPR